MSVRDIDYARCAVCGGFFPNGPADGGGFCSCIRCEDCGHVFAEGETYCVPCDDETPNELDRFFEAYANGEFNRQDCNRQVNR